MAFSVKLNKPLYTQVNFQEYIQICAYSTEGTSRDTKILISLSNPDHVDDVVFTTSDGTIVPFNVNGVFIYDDVILNSCANRFGRFLKPGEYVFTVALLDQTTNELLDEEIAIFKVCPSKYPHRSTDKHRS